MDLTCGLEAIDITVLYLEVILKELVVEGGGRSREEESTLSILQRH